ncbi:MAG: sulfatase-like hydrolase/transferase [Planctomycetota bacterium]
MAGAVYADERPNIVIIMTDDSGYSDLGSFGGEIDTPHLDRLAENGIRLSNFYTNGRCSPTRASLLTGLDSARVGFGGGVVGDWWREMPHPAHRGRLPYDTPLLSELLRAGGYRTLMAGKWHLGGSTMKFNPQQQQQLWKRYHLGWELTDEEIELDFLALPLQRGFDEYFGLYGAQDSLFFVPGQPHPIKEGNEPAELDYDRVYTMHCYAKQARYNVNHGKTAKAFYATDGVTDRAIQMIEDAAGDDAPPFFLYVAHRAPHVPLQAPEELVQKYLKLYADIRAVEAARLERLKQQGLVPPNTDYRPAWIQPGAEDEFRLKMALHAAMMEKIDENVGCLIETLEDTGELDNTLILFFSDNGNASHLSSIFNTPYRGSKALLWEGGTRSHFIAVWPNRITPGTLSHQQAWVADIMPTVLNLAGIGYPDTFRGKPTEDLAGRDMLAVLQGKPRPPAEALFFNDKGQQSVIYQGRWKLLINPGWFSPNKPCTQTTYELYDLENDPSELNNLAEAKPELVRMLEKKCEAWKQDMGIVDYAALLKLRPNDHR